MRMSQSWLKLDSSRNKIKILYTTSDYLILKKKFIKFQANPKKENP